MECQRIGGQDVDLRTEHRVHRTLHEGRRLGDERWVGGRRDALDHLDTGADRIGDGAGGVLGAGSGDERRQVDVHPVRLRRRSIEKLRTLSGSTHVRPAASRVRSTTSNKRQGGTRMTTTKINIAAPVAPVPRTTTERSRWPGLLTVVASAIILDGAVLTSAYRSSSTVSEDQLSFPWGGATAVATSLSWAAAQALLLVGLVAFARSAAPAGRLGRRGAWLAVAGGAVFVIAHGVSAVAYNAATDDAQALVAMSLFGLGTVLPGGRCADGRRGHPTVRGVVGMAPPHAARARRVDGPDDPAPAHRCAGCRRRCLCPRRARAWCGAAGRRTRNRSLSRGQTSARTTAAAPATKLPRLRVGIPMPRRHPSRRSGAWRPGPVAAAFHHGHRHVGDGRPPHGGPGEAAISPTSTSDRRNCWSPRRSPTVSRSAINDSTPLRRSAVRIPSLPA